MPLLTETPAPRSITTFRPNSPAAQRSMSPASQRSAGNPKTCFSSIGSESKVPHSSAVGLMLRSSSKSFLCDSPGGLDNQANSKFTFRQDFTCAVSHRKHLISPQAGVFGGADVPAGKNEMIGAMVHRIPVGFKTRIACQAQKFRIRDIGFCELRRWRLGMPSVVRTAIVVRCRGGHSLFAWNSNMTLVI